MLDGGSLAPRKTNMWGVEALTKLSNRQSCCHRNRWRCKWFRLLPYIFS